MQRREFIAAVGTAAALRQAFAQAAGGGGHASAEIRGP